MVNDDIMTMLTISKRRKYPFGSCYISIFDDAESMGIPKHIIDDMFKDIHRQLKSSNI